MPYTQPKPYIHTAGRIQVKNARPNAMEERHDSAADSGSTLSFYATSGQSPQATTHPQIWMLRRDPELGSDRFSKRESVVIRDSVAYPSESSFEDTIIKGTAQTGQRNPSKPRLIDLDRIRRKMRSATTRRGSQRSTATDTSTLSLGCWLSDMRPPEQIMLSPITSQRAVTEMYHASQSDIMLHSRARASSLREEQETTLRFQNGARGGQSSETVGNTPYESELSGYTLTQNSPQPKHSFIRALCCVLY
ncbi:uncharacterized protein F4817DRAFT_188489 [Daldinia loculata]|uniref:uncharacterized protein n=1 Tax=Daldinia loculata TaxID=103429 RepID=UPI0020C27A31|nr:uncharacterized protein F4817DRAFT_188489 [Daldinia loculata]KAI1645301.1 hypothetical protein F4817DRAFT_188489 [Daldinia loculata]